MAPLSPSPIYHGLYTNAFGRRGQGFRHLFLAPEWPARDRQRIGRWLETLKPLPGSPEGERIAVNSFRIGPTIHACLARVDADFALDEHGRRGGTLVHALFLPLAEGRPCGHFTAALLAASRRFTRPEADDADRLEAYLEQCRAVREIVAPPISSEVPHRHGSDFLTRFLAYSSGPPRSKEAVFAPASAPFADALADGAAALPPRLRLAGRWALGLRPTPEMSFVARTAPAGQSLVPLPRGPGSVYAQWLQHQGIQLAEDWDVRSWEALMERTRRS